MFQLLNDFVSILKSLLDKCTDQANHVYICFSGRTRHAGCDDAL